MVIVEVASTTFTRAVATSSRIPLKHWINGGETQSPNENASRTTAVQRDFERAEVREPAAVYRLKLRASG